ncbi:dynein regulatory complex subunit 5 [Caerostris extrusa]|uniref:Dynein regulatory complex subunit 5 n=1 Tax=Caerostris extrusa TaxID=172846 RepID=A0AAV4TH29_CAEEX|nr:dynein regulatory complex subunit 5 [Caerostris extrusa]
MFDLYRLAWTIPIAIKLSNATIITTLPKPIVSLLFMFYPLFAFFAFPAPRKEWTQSPATQQQRARTRNPSSPPQMTLAPRTRHHSRKSDPVRRSILLRPSPPTTSDITSKSAPTESRTESEDEDADWNQQDVMLPEDILKLDARRIRAEDFQWALSPVPGLSTIIIRSAKHVTGIIICYYPIPGPGLQNLKDNAETEQWRQILELLPLTIPFKYTLPIIDNGIYWERQCLQRWPSSDIWRYNDNWKTMLIERVVQEAIENFAPETSDFDELQHFLKAFKDYDYRLQILKLQKIERKPFVVDLSLEDFDDLLDEFISKPEIHTFFLNLEKVLACLSNLNEFNFIPTPSSMDPESHQLSIPDFNSCSRDCVVSRT